MKKIVQRLWQKKPDPQFITAKGTEVKILFSSENPSLLGKTMQAAAIELSPRGIRLEVEQPIKIDSVLDISIRLQGNNRIYNLTGNVRYRLPAVNGRFHCVLVLRERSDIRSDLQAWESSFEKNLKFSVAV